MFSGSDHVLRFTPKIISSSLELKPVEPFDTNGISVALVLNCSSICSRVMAEPEIEFCTLRIKSSNFMSIISSNSSPDFSSKVSICA